MYFCRRTKRAAEELSKEEQSAASAERKKHTHRSGGESDDKCNYRRAERDCFIADKTGECIFCECCVSARGRNNAMES
jgi:hypothetical protein